MVNYDMPRKASQKPRKRADKSTPSPTSKTSRSARKTAQPRLPSNVQIGPVLFQVRRVPQEKLKEAVGFDVWGFCSPEEQVILLREGMSPEREWNILLHEILHAALDVGGLSANVLQSNDQLEEVLVWALSALLSPIVTLA